MFAGVIGVGLAGDATSPRIERQRPEARRFGLGHEGELVAARGDRHLGVDSRARWSDGPGPPIQPSVAGSTSILQRFLTPRDAPSMYSASPAGAHLAFTIAERPASSSRAGRSSRHADSTGGPPAIGCVQNPGSSAHRRRETRSRFPSGCHMIRPTFRTAPTPPRGSVSAAPASRIQTDTGAARPADAFWSGGRSTTRIFDPSGDHSGQ